MPDILHYNGCGYFYSFIMTEIKNINSKEAWKLLQDAQKAVLVDVRTKEEWEIVGRPDLSSINKAVILNSWLLLPKKELNQNFLSDLQDAVLSDVPVLFICKSGVRSHAAARYAMNQGYQNCFNVIDGFEGNESGLKGWKNNLLPVVIGSI